MKSGENNNIDIVKIKSILQDIAEDFGPPAKDTILFANFGKHLEEIKMIIGNIHSNGVILDVGGGLGVNLLAIRKLLGENSPLFLLDRFEEYVGKNRMGEYDRNLKFLEKADIKIVNQDFWKNKVLPFENDTFEVATIFDVTEHLPANPVYLLKEIYRVLKPGGKIILGGPNSSFLLKRMRLLFGKHPYMPFDLWTGDNYYSHYREYNKAEQIELLKIADFKNILAIMSLETSRTQNKNRYHNDKKVNFSFRTIILYILYLFEVLNPNLRETIYCIGEK
ncbi:MAG: class I SAM-dependent methyltransferase [Candidatus Humimicrobiaceae bacterium]